MTAEQLEALMEWAKMMVRLEMESGGAQEMGELRARRDLYDAFGLAGGKEFSPLGEES